MSRKRLVCGAGGFIGSHLVKYLINKGYRVDGVDLKSPDFSPSKADNFYIGDLRDKHFVNKLFEEGYEVVYQLAADMGGAGYLFSEENDANVMHNSALVNLNILDTSVKRGVQKLFFSSSACVYPEYNQLDPNNPICKEDSVYPAFPDSEYGWEKLFSERLYFSYMKNHNLNVKVARFHNIYGPEGTFYGGKEKVPAALARKVILAANRSEIEIWGDGKQSRSFLYIDDCISAIHQLVESNFSGPVNIGSEELITINCLAQKFIHFSGKELALKHVKGPQGVRGRTSDNNLIKQKLNWSPETTLDAGLERTYNWISNNIHFAQAQIK